MVFNRNDGGKKITSCYQQLNGRHFKAIFTTVLLLALPIVAACSFLDPCGNRIIKRIPAPKDPWEVVVFERDCGATTAKSIQISIIGLGRRLPNESGNVFIAEDPANEVRVRWLSNREVEVTHRPGIKLFKSEPQFQHVRITYRITGTEEMANPRLQADGLQASPSGHR